MTNGRPEREYVATESFATAEVLVRRGDRYAADHPLVSSHAAFFAPLATARDGKHVIARESFFSEQVGTVRRGEILAADHPAVKANAQSFVPVGLPESEWPRDVY